MRIRSIRPEFWSSEDITALSWDTRLIFIGMWSYVDDNGVGRDIEKLIAGALLSLEDDPRDTLAKVSRALATLSERGMVSRYSVDGKRYVHITSWTTHQRIDKAAKSRYPLPTCDNADPRDTLATPSRDLREGSPIGEGEKGRSVEGEKPPASAAPSSTRFDTFWELYPSKVGKVAAHKAFVKAVKLAGLDAVLAGVHRYANDRNLPDRQFIPNPATWLNQGRWDDAPCAPRTDRPDTTPRTGSSIWDRKPPVRSAS